MTSRTVLMRFVALLLALVVVTSACSSDDEPETEATGDDPSAETEDPATEGEGEGEGTEEATAEEAEVPPPSGPSPNTGDHWHVPYGIYVCQEGQSSFIPNLIDPNNPDGLFTLGDGIIHITPLNQETSGEGATLAKFMEAQSFQMTDDGLIAPNGELVEEGFECDGEPTILQVARWQLDATDAEPVIFTEGFDQIKFENDNEIITIAYLPEGAEIPQPPTIGGLATLTDIDPADIPELPEGFTVAFVEPPGPGAALTEDTPCPEEGAERTTSFAGPPPMCIDPDASYSAVFKTNLGDITVALDTENTPNTVNNFVVLSQYGYYDNTSMFRTDTSIEIIQGGSPNTNSPSDPGPGYTITDEGDFVLDEATGQLTGPYSYVPGDLVMARSAGPDSSGAQYFFAVGPATANLDGQGTYIKFGETTEGLELLEEILASHVEDPSSGLGGGPGIEVIVETIEIVEN